ncbi:hypothetical protein ABS71_01935 [bacterium SCN 62-11]|nr:MAG: hypothetical protein ABS71_01935 [bacterium SCN 62-11]
MNLYLLTSVANAGCGPAGETEAVSAETMDDALRQWIAQHGWIQLLNNSLTTTYLSHPTGRAPEIHPAAPGRWYAGAVRLTGPVEHTREDWQLAIGLAVAAAQEHHRLHPPKLPEYASRRSRYRKNWWKDDYPGKIDSNQL